MAHLVVYRAAPEYIVRTYLADALPRTGLPERGIDCPVVHGHPLFAEGITAQGFDRNFPRIGVEWTRDKRTDHVGQAFREFAPTPRWRALLNDYKRLPPAQRAASDAVIDALTEAPRIQSWTHHVESEVLIAGFAAGPQGRTTLRALYETTEALLAPLAHDLMEAFPGVKVWADEAHEVNITSDQFAAPVWGFEILVRISQARRLFRAKPKLPFPDNPEFDIHLVDSRTEFRFGGLFEFDPVK
jgi:hypothetical protein